jgi:hypothetical protein
VLNCDLLLDLGELFIELDGLPLGQ